MLQADNSVKNWWNLPISNPKPDLLNINACTNIGIKHGFSCINIRQVSREVLKTEARGHGFQHLPGDLANVNALKNHVRSLLLHKSENICYISLYFLHYFVLPFHWCLANAFPRTMLILGPGSTHLVTAAILWPRYRHIESCVAVH